MIIAEEHLRDRSTPVVLRRSRHRTERVAERSPFSGAIQSLAKIYVQPRYIDAYRALVHASRAPGAELRKARVFQLARARFPRTADASRIRFATKRVTSYRLKIRARIQARPAANAIQRLVQHGIIAHSHPSVVDQHQMKFPRFDWFAR